MAVSSPPDATSELIGRDDEVARLDALLDRVRDRGGALVIRGEPGIGKSALLDRARGRASSLGARTLATVGVESESELAFAGLHQLLGPIGSHIERLPDPQRQALDAAFGVDDLVEAGSVPRRACRLPARFRRGGLEPTAVDRGRRAVARPFEP